MKLLLLKNIVSQTKSRFRNLSIKRTALTMILVVAGMLFSSSAFARTYKVTSFTVGAQQATAAYGTASTTPFTLTFRETQISAGGTSNQNRLTITWTGGTPTGITTSIGGGQLYTPNGDNQVVGLNVFITTATQPGTYTFTISTTETNGGVTPQTATGTFTVGPKTLTVGGTLDAANKPYDGTTAATLTGTGTLAGVINGDNVTLTGTPTGVFVSSAAGVNKNVTISGYTLGGTDAAKYTLTQPTVQATIATLPLTITATDPGKTYGTALPSGASTINFTATGALAGETVTSVTLTPNANGLSTTAAAGTAYSVVPSAPTGTGGFLASNYTITPVNFNGTIGKAPLAITSTDVNKTYGTALANGTKTTGFSSVGLKNGQTIGNVFMTYGTGALATDAVGTYANQVTPSAAGGGTFSASNYTITYNNQGDIIVGAATLTIKADNQTKAYGAAVPTLTYTPSGFVNGDNASIITTAPTLTTTATAASNAGTYPINISGAVVSNSNYTVVQTAGTLTVSAEPSTYDWTGAVSTVWNNPLNWNVSGIQQTSLYPGSTTTDDALIGVNEAIVNQPTLTATLPNSLNSITFGNVSIAPILTVNTGITLNTSNFTVNTGSTATLTDNGTVNVTNSYTNNTGATLAINGSKSFTVNTFNNITNAGTLTQTGTGSVTFSNTTFAGSITNSGTINQSGTGSFTMNILALVGTITNSGTINQTGNASFTATINSFGGNIANTGTINQSSTSGTMTFGVPYSNSTAGSKLIQTGTGTLAFSSTFNNAGTTTFGPGTVTVAGNFTNSSGTTTFGSGTATLAGTFTNTSGTTAFGTGSASIASDYNNSGTVTTSTGPVTMSGAFTNNSGTTTFGTGLITFNSNSGNTKITMTPNATLTFVNVLFTNNGHFLFKTGGGASSSFAVASTGVLTLAGTSTQIDFANAIGLTLNSDATGSATIAAIPAGCTISAPNKVFVQRFMSGNNDINKRGYRLLSSSVYTGNDGTSNVSDLLYLTNNTHVSGDFYGSNGFIVTTTINPSIYLFREDVPPPPNNTTVFTTGYNWKGVAKINSTPNSYMIGTQFKNDPANLLDTLTTIPAGNAVLFFFRGDISQAVTPIAPPIDVTFTHQGTLNTGPITVRLWYSNAANGLGNNLSYTSANTAANTGSTSVLVAGFALVGNPYPSTINWEKYNNPNAPNAITGTGGLGNFIYEFNVDSKQYGVYEPSSTGTDLTSEIPGDAVSINGASNLIASGEGFFVQAGAAGQTLTFNESAKTNSQSSPATLLNFMGKPVATTVAPRPTLNLKLVKDSLNSDEVVIRMSKKASAKYIVGEDAPDVDGSSALETLSSYSSDSSRLAINTIPFPGVQPEIVRILADATSSGSYTLTVPKLNNMPALYQVWLKDAFAADSVQLKANTSYPFTIDKSNAATFGNTRFTVVIRQDTAFAYKLLDFTASKTDHQSDVQLVWKTANEGNYTNFTVERSNDNGKTFTVVGGMAGTGAGNYSLVDKNPEKGRNLYRLKQEDINDSVTYSKVVDVQFGDVFSKLHIFPNPATHTVNLAIAEEGYYKGNYSISFVNSSGRVVKEVQSSQADWQGNITYLMPGTYLVRVVNTKTQSLVGENKFVKL